MMHLPYRICGRSTAACLLVRAQTSQFVEIMKFRFPLCSNHDENLDSRSGFIVLVWQWHHECFEALIKINNIRKKIICNFYRWIWISRGIYTFTGKSEFRGAGTVETPSIGESGLFPPSLFDAILAKEARTFHATGRLAVSGDFRRAEEPHLSKAFIIFQRRLLCLRPGIGDTTPRDPTLFYRIVEKYGWDSGFTNEGVQHRRSGQKHSRKEQQSPTVLIY